MRPALTLAALLAVSAPAFAQEPSVTYTVIVDSPGSVAVGAVPIRVRVTGGVGEADFAAFHMRSMGGWSEDDAVRLPRTGENYFEDTISTESLPNESYRIEVRVWRDFPPYNSNDPRTFARAMLDVAVDNPPSTPENLEALTPATALRVGWGNVSAAERSDFVGYRVFLRKDLPCPTELAAYAEVATVQELSYEDAGLRTGDYCVRVAAVRESVVSQEILSPPSPPVRVSIAKRTKSVIELPTGSSGGGGVVFRRGGIGITETQKAKPPPVPVLGDGDPVIADGEFIEDLPYGPQTVTQAPGGGIASGEAASVEAGVDPKRVPTLFASGLILATAAGLLRRFLWAAPRA